MFKPVLNIKGVKATEHFKPNASLSKKTHLEFSFKIIELSNEARYSWENKIAVFNVSDRQVHLIKKRVYQVWSI